MSDDKKVYEPFSGEWIEPGKLYSDSKKNKDKSKPICLGCGKEMNPRLSGKTKYDGNKKGYICFACTMKIGDMKFKNMTAEEISQAVAEHDKSKIENKALKQAKKEEHWRQLLGSGEILPEDFPETLDNLKISSSYEAVFVTGVLHDFKGDSAQDNIELLEKNERVYIERCATKKFPNAMRIVNSLNCHLGWIPEDNDDDTQQAQIVDDLDSCNEYRCKVCETPTFNKNNEEYFGLYIDIAFYE